MELMYLLLILESSCMLASAGFGAPTSLYGVVWKSGLSGCRWWYSALLWLCISIY